MLSLLRRVAVSGFLAIAIGGACTSRGASDRPVDGAVEISPADYATENARLADCPAAPDVDLSETDVHPVRPGATLRLPRSFVPDADDAEAEHWSDGENASIEIWHTSEPSDGMATSGPGVSISEISQCTLRVAAAVAKMYMLRISSLDDRDTTYLALIHTYPRPGLAFNIAIEAPRSSQRDSLIAFVTQITLDGKP